MSAIGTKRTSASALQMSASGGKADMPFQWEARGVILRSAGNPGPKRCFSELVT